jgi:imidazolonepropionase-like amidohydrolase
MTVVLANARVVDVVAGRSRDADVRIEGDLVAAVAPRLSRDGAEVRDVGGAFLLPGMISVHTHPGLMSGFRNDWNGVTPERMLRDLAIWQRFGVTTVQSLGVDPEAAYELASLAHAGARMLTAGHGFGVKGGLPPFPMDPPGPLRLDDPRAIRRAIDEQAARGASAVKLWFDDWYGQVPKMAPEIAKAVIDAAAANGLRSYAHVYYVDDAKMLVRAGVRTFAHMPRDRVADAELWALMRESDVAMVPTLTVPDSNVAYLEGPPFLDDPLFRLSAGEEGVAFVRSEEYLRGVRAKKEAGRLRADLVDALTNVRGAYEAGVRFGFGTDDGVAQRAVGFYEHRELELLVAAGVPPAAAIRMATADSAALLGRDDLGQLAVGRRADIVVLDGDPLADVRNARRIREVWQDGRVVAGAL